MATTTTKRSTWYCFLALLLAGLCLEHSYHEMHLSKVLVFASFGVWAHEVPKPWRWVQLSMVALSCVAVLGSWYTYRHQPLVHLGRGVYLRENATAGR
jgi:hypothetical protein